MCVSIQDDLHGAYRITTGANRENMACFAQLFSFHGTASEIGRFRILASLYFA